MPQDHHQPATRSPNQLLIAMPPAAPTTGLDFFRRSSAPTVASVIDDLNTKRKKLAELISANRAAARLEFGCWSTKELITIAVITFVLVPTLGVGSCVISPNDAYYYNVGLPAGVGIGLGFGALLLLLCAIHNGYKAYSLPRQITALCENIVHQADNIINAVCSSTDADNIINAVRSSTDDETQKFRDDMQEFKEKMLKISGNSCPERDIPQLSSAPGSVRDLVIKQSSQASETTSLLPHASSSSESEARRPDEATRYGACAPSQ